LTSRSPKLDPISAKHHHDAAFLCKRVPVIDGSAVLISPIFLDFPPPFRPLSLSPPAIWPLPFPPFRIVLKPISVACHYAVIYGSHTAEDKLLCICLPIANRFFLALFPSFSGSPMLRLARGSLISRVRSLQSHFVTSQWPA